MWKYNNNLRNKKYQLVSDFPVVIFYANLQLEEVNLLSLNMFAYTSTWPVSLFDVLRQQCLYHRHLICRFVLHTGQRWTGIYSTNIVLYRYDRYNGEKKQGVKAIYEEGAGCKVRQTLKYFKLIQINYDYDTMQC